MTTPLRAPAKPAQPSISDLYAEISALRKENAEMRHALDVAEGKVKVDAFAPRKGSVHDGNGTLTADRDGASIVADRRGVAVIVRTGTGDSKVLWKIQRCAAPYANFQAGAQHLLTETGVAIGEPTVALC